MTAFYVSCIIGAALSVNNTVCIPHLYVWMVWLRENIPRYYFCIVARNKVAMQEYFLHVLILTLNKLSSVQLLSTSYLLSSYAYKNLNEPYEE